MKIAPTRLAMTASTAVFLWSQSALADGKQQRFELTPMLGYVAGGTLEDEFTNQEFELDDSSAFGLRLNIRAGNQATWEILYARQETQTPGPALSELDVVIDKIEFGGTYEVNLDATRPYAAATVGVSRFRPEDTTFRDDSYFSFSVGGGVKFFSDRRTGFTVDARWVGAVLNDDTDIFCLSSDGLTCLIQADAGLVSQFRLFAGFSLRF